MSLLVFCHSLTHTIGMVKHLISVNMVLKYVKKSRIERTWPPLHAAELHRNRFPQTNRPLFSSARWNNVYKPVTMLVSTWDLLFLHMHYCHSILIKLSLRGAWPLMWFIIAAKSNTWESLQCSFCNSTAALIESNKFRVIAKLNVTTSSLLTVSSG